MISEWLFPILQYVNKRYGIYCCVKVTDRPTSMLQHIREMWPPILNEFKHQNRLNLFLIDGHVRALEDGTGKANCTPRHLFCTSKIAPTGRLFPFNNAHQLPRTEAATTVVAAVDTLLPILMTMMI